MDNKRMHNNFIKTINTLCDLINFNSNVTDRGVNPSPLQSINFNLNAPGGRRHTFPQNPS